MRPIHWIIASALAFVCLVAFCFAPAWAQDAAPVIAPSSIWYEVWTIVQPVVVLLVSTVGPVLVTWIAARLIALLKVTDEKQRVEIEAKLREALHQSALNAVKYALVRTGLSVNHAEIPGQLVSIATEYVREKNPEAVQRLGIDAKALEEIIMSKVPELVKAVPRPPEPQ